MRARLVLMGVALAAGTPQAVPARAQPSSFADRIAALKISSNVPAIGGVTFSSTSIGVVAVAGVRKLGDPAQVTADDQWHIGSLTKSFTSTLIAKRVERGELKWDMTLGELIGPARARKFDLSIH